MTTGALSSTARVNQEHRRIQRGRGDVHCLVQSEADLGWRRPRGSSAARTPWSAVLLVLGLCLVVAPVQALGPNWTSTAGPVGAAVNAFAVAPNGDTLVGLRNGGLFRWSETEATWQPAGLAEQTVISLLTTSRGEVLAGARSTIFLSDDNGLSWSDIGNAIATGGWVSALAESPKGDVFAGTQVGLFRLIRETNRWDLTLPQFSADLAINPEGHIFSAQGGRGLMRSSDDGATWQQVLALDSGILSLATGSDGIVLAGSHRLDYPGEWGLLLLSTDFGLTWENLPVDFSGSSVGALLITASGAYLAGTASEVYLVRPGGLFYTEGGPWTVSALDNVDIRALAETTNRRILAAGNSSVFRADTVDGQWSRMNSGLCQTDVWALAAGSSGIFAGGDGFGVQVLPDSASSWSQTEISDDYVNSLLVADDGTAFAAVQQAGLIRSTDDGQSWQSTGAFAALGSSIALVQAASGAVCSANLGIACSWDSGETWTQHLPPTLARPLSLAAHPEGPLFLGARIWEGDTKGEVLRFDPATANWSSVHSDELPINAVAVGGDGTIAIGTGCPFGTCQSGGGSRVLLSSDLGSTWQPSAYRGHDVTALAFDENGNLYVATYSGIKVSRNHGATFTAFDRGLGQEWIKALVVHQGQLFAATFSHGVWRCDLQSPFVSENPHPSAASS